MRADAKKNFDHLLATARDVVAEHGADASLRDVARRADVGLGTLYRHFPTREALLDALLRSTFDELTAKADELEKTSSPTEALTIWLRDCVAGATQIRGITPLMMTAMENPESALHASCVTMRAAGARLLARAQDEGSAREDLDGGDLFALVGALAWLGDLPATASRAGHLLEVVTSAVLTR
ncbi:TetR/AcrR family transcriptional regulator [Catenulispora pinisilvae]|uniref:TetR/AcrR family transcriptional regulator n=1 Tax=Catenulispora pinisilvae TaxID=2705253 RepID=UPI001891E4C8|nr:helix-turn-helix domain-containing protein [Catenulispora pinisilvae]